MGEFSAGVRQDVSHGGMPQNGICLRDQARTLNHMGTTLKLFIFLVAGYLAVAGIKRLWNVGQKATTPQAPMPMPSNEPILTRIGRRLRRGAVAVMWLLLAAVILKFSFHALMALSTAHVRN
jgi:hypothetical protein